jgi:hypothetical protein
MKINKMSKEQLVKLQYELETKKQQESLYYRHVSEEVRRRFTLNETNT